MSGTDGEEALQGYDNDGEEELGLFGDLSSFEGLALEEDAAENENLCPQCLEKYKNPRVLSCLHVLCETCLKELLVAAEKEEENDEAVYMGRGKPQRALSCPLCKQETMIGERGLSSLHMDPVYQKKSASDSTLSGLICNSCKANEEAVAKCMDCDNLLCSICHTAHKYMRCFDNHKVITFEELSQSGQSVPIKRNPNCPRHPNEPYTHFCLTCQVTSCSQCWSVFHQALDHRTERLVEAEARCRAELTQFSQEIGVRQNTCRQGANKLDKMLCELQRQYESAKTSIAEAHASYIALLDKRRDAALEELGNLHSKQELGIMEAMERVDRTRDRIQTAVRYTKLLLSEAEPTGMLHVAGTVRQQMQLLHSTASRSAAIPDDMSGDASSGGEILLKFESTPSRLEEALNSAYGYFIQPRSSGGSSSAGSSSKPVSSLGLPTPSSTPQPPSPTHSSPLEGGGPSHPPPHGMYQHQQQHHLMKSSDLSNMMNNDLSSSSSRPSPADLVPSGMTSIQEYNLQQLANLASKVDLHHHGHHGHPSSTMLLQQQLIQQEQQQQQLRHHLQMQQQQRQSSFQQQQQRATPSPHSSANASQAQVSPFMLADLLSGDMNNMQALSNLQALAKLGSHGSLGLDSMGGASHNVSSSLGHSGVQGMGTNLGLLVNGGVSPHDLASTLGAPPFVPSNSPRPPSVLSLSPLGQRNLLTSSSSSSSSAINPKYHPMQTRVRFGLLGSAKGQFNSPHGFCLGADEDIVVADTNNHRIQVFDKDGIYKYDFGNPGKEEGQVWYPRKVAVIRSSGKIVVCDRGSERSRMQIFTRTGQFVKRIVIRYIDIVAGLAIDDHGHIVAVDSVSPTVFRITENGDLIKWFDVSDRMREPSDLAIHGKEYFICDFKGHCVVVFNEEGEYMRRIGCESVTNFPNGVDLSDAGDVLVADSHGNRFHVAVFSRSGTLLSEFECPHVKVSRCCGLKITSEGYVVTLAKNNHYVLIVNTLYIV